LQRACRGDKPVTFADYSLNVLGALRIITQGLAKLAHGGVNTAICLKEYVFAPELFHDLVAAYKIPLLLYQQDEQFHRDLFQFQRLPTVAQLKAARI
jgi:hypothetical protein